MYYFAYGSNLDLNQMRRLCGWHCYVLGQAELKGYEVGLDPRGYATIKPNGKDKVFGLLFDIDQQGIETLDEFEGYPEVFGRKEVVVMDDSGQQYSAWVYMEPEDQFGGKQANADHWQRIIAHAKENHLPMEWIEKLESFIQAPSGIPRNLSSGMNDKKNLPKAE